MGSSKRKRDAFIGLSPLPNYFLKRRVGTGRIGTVFAAERPEPRDTLACKVIKEGRLKKGWQRELEKVASLRGIPGVVQYHSHGSTLDHFHRPFTYILFEFIDGKNLADYTQQPYTPLDIPFIELLATTILQVLHACRAVGIVHGDLHEGNILIRKPDPRLPGSPLTVWISDFGYGGSHNQMDPKDDYRQFFSIVSSLLHRLDEASLNPPDRVMYHKLEEFLNKKVLEVDPTQGRFVGSPELLLSELQKLRPDAERESTSAQKGQDIKEAGDYLFAEALGFKKDEWKDLFVSEFLAAQDLLNKNITVLTGARGCGKTMTFRRLTVLMDKVIGQRSGVIGADQFIGFYLNCRDLAEAFPWIPHLLSEGMSQQIIHYFHLCYLSEIFKALAISDLEHPERFDWLNGFLTNVFGSRYRPLPRGANALAHGRAVIESEKERCRTSRLGQLQGLTKWPLARLDFLGSTQVALETHVSWVGHRPLYFFLDDYTIPTLPRNVQQVLNPIIFKRSDKLFFKISTEAANSFDRRGLRGKALELDHDFRLLDLATESLHQDDKDKFILLNKIFKPRIARHRSFLGKDLDLTGLLGQTPVSNNKLAHQMRDLARNRLKRKISYYGAGAFVGMWTSDMRTMIQMLTDILRDANGKKILPIPKRIQDKAYRTKGGEFLVFTESINDPSSWEKAPTSTKPGAEYGTHLRNIAEAFINVSRYELTQAPLISNRPHLNPRQAFRLEIIDKFNVPDDAMLFYDGLVRWHIFLQDWRGKSVRGMITPRLYLNRVLIPFANLTFSSHDNIPITNEEFVRLLLKPRAFLRYWKEKRVNQMRRHRLRNKPTLWDTSQEGESR